MTTKTSSQVTAPVAGDDGEAMEKTQEKPLITPTKNTTNMHWYVACVRMNYEKKFKLAIELDFQKKQYDIEAWIPLEKRAVLNSRGKRTIREYVVLSTFVFVRVEKAHLNDVRFRSDVYKMLSLPGKSTPYIISDAEFENFRRIVDTGNAEFLNRPLKKGDRVRIIEGDLVGCEAYVQSVKGKKAIIGNEIMYIGGATIMIDKDKLEYIAQK